jgi:hypothetical protein
MNESRQFEYRATATVILIHIVLMATGAQVLAGVFELPDVLRESAEYRLGLFLENRSIIIPMYYLLALTGLTQLTIALLLHQSFRDRGNTLLVLATAFGVLSGVWQVMGFLRWTILIPYIAEAMTEVEATGVPAETVAFLEGFANRYIGMAVGEHLGFVGQTVWTILLGIVMLRDKLFTNCLAWSGIAFGILTIPVCLETLGGPFVMFQPWMLFVITGWVLWLFFVGLSLFGTKAETGEGPQLGWKSAVAYIVLYAVFTVPALGD